MTTYELKRAVHWLLYGETGISSKTICSVMMGDVHTYRNIHSPKFDIPHDDDDFRRCYLLLRAIPEWRPRLPEVARVFPKWSALVEHWDELTEIYENAAIKGHGYSKLYERIQELERNNAG